MSAKFCFADAVESMMEFRRSVGLSDRATKSVAAMFGEYCTENSITIPLLTREVAEGWISPTFHVRLGGELFSRRNAA